MPGLLIVCAPGLFRAGTLLGGLTRDGLLAIIGVTLSNSAIPQYRADNRLRAGDCEKSMDSLYPWLSSAVVLSVSPPVSLRNEKYTYCARKARVELSFHQPSVTGWLQTQRLCGRQGRHQGGQIRGRHTRHAPVAAPLAPRLFTLQGLVSE